MTIVSARRSQYSVGTAELYLQRCSTQVMRQDADSSRTDLPGGMHTQRRQPSLDVCDVERIDGMAGATMSEWCVIVMRIR
ncbi:MAG: hypothetical protein ABI852_14495 [Gemmatimonadaceae bacterium]